MPKTNDGRADLLSAPLCCRYLLAVFEDTHITVGQGEDGCNQVLRWGLGTLSDGQLELLGVWQSASTDETLSARISEDLQLRGVEEVRFVAGLESSGFERAQHALRLGAEALPSSSHLSLQVGTKLRAQDREAVSDFLASLYSASTAKRAGTALAKFAASPVGVRCPELVEGWRLAIQQLSPFYASAPRIRRVVRNADAAATQLTRVLRRAVNRHGCFYSLEAATSFAAETLIRAGVHLCARAVGCATSPRYRAAGVSARSGVSAAGL